MQPKFTNRKNGFYARFGGEQVSVTTVNQVIAKPMLINWACKQGALIQKEKNPQSEEELLDYFKSISEEAKSRGSKIHEYVEHHIKFGEMPPIKNNYLEGYKELIKHHKIEPLKILLHKDKTTDGKWANGEECLSVETEVHNDKHEYAGTCDLWGYLDGVLSFTDFKTNDKGSIYGETALQLASYRKAIVRMVRTGEIVCDVTWKELAKARLFAIALSSDGKYCVKEFKEPSKDYYFKIWLGFKNGWWWSQGNYKLMETYATSYSDSRQPKEQAVL